MFSLSPCTVHPSVQHAKIPPPATRCLPATNSIATTAAHQLDGHHPQVLDKHTNLATALLGVIKGRGLDQFHQLGEELLTGKADLAGVVKVVQGARGTPADKTRLAIIYLLAHEGA